MYDTLPTTPIGALTLLVQQNETIFGIDLSNTASGVDLTPGTASAGISTTAARSDHIHPLQTSVTENAGTASKLATARTITISGSVSGSASFDGSSNITITTTGGSTLQLGSTVGLVPDTASAGTSITAARSDHVHPLQTTVTGNAGTATKLATARTIAISGGATGTATSFDGSGNITIPVTMLDATKLTGTASINTTGNAATANTAVKLDTARTITVTGTVSSSETFDGSSNITIATTGGSTVQLGNTVGTTLGTASAGTATTAARSDHVHPLQVTVTGNAATTTKLATARTITLSGVATGSAPFDGSANVTIPVKIPNQYGTGNEMKFWIGNQLPLAADRDPYTLYFVTN